MILLTILPHKQADLTWDSLRSLEKNLVQPLVVPHGTRFARLKAFLFNRNPVPDGTRYARLKTFGSAVEACSTCDSLLSLTKILVWPLNTVQHGTRFARLQHLLFGH